MTSVELHLGLRATRLRRINVALLVRALATSWRTFDDLIALQEAVAERFEAYSDVYFASLIAYPFICTAINGLAQ